MNYKTYTNIDEAINDEQEMKKKYGFYIHCVVNDNNNKFINMHTHGLLENFGLLDVQLSHIENDLEHTRDLFYKLIEIYINEKLVRLKDGDLISIGVDKYIAIRVIRDEFMILNYRFIFPDPKGKYPWEEGCDRIYKSQWTKNDEKHSKRIINY